MSERERKAGGGSSEEKARAGAESLGEQHPLSRLHPNPVIARAMYRRHLQRKESRKKADADAEAAGGGGGELEVSSPDDPAERAAAAVAHGQRDIDGRPEAGASDGDWTHYLTDLHRFLLDQTGAEKDQLLDIREHRQAHPIVGGISEAAASIKALERVKAPDEGIWDQVFAQLVKAHALFAGEKPDLEGARREMATAVRMFEDAHKRVYEYRTRVEGGAQTAANVLRGIEVGCDITLTILSAGVGAEANLLKLGARGAFKAIAAQAATSGLLKTGAKAAVVGGANKLLQGGAEEATSQAIGTDDLDVAKVLREAGEAAVMNFLGVLVGGSLSKVFMRELGQVLGSRMAPEALLALAEKYGIQGVVPPELFVTRGWRFLVGVAGDACTTTLLVALSTLVEQLRTGGKHPSGEQFAAMVVQQMVQNGLLQLILTTLMRERALKGSSTSAPASGETGHAPPRNGREAAAPPGHTNAKEAPSPDKARAISPPADEETLARLQQMRTIHDPAKLEESRKNDAAFHTRKAENEKLAEDSERLESDLKVAGLTKEQYLAMKQGHPETGERVPLCFESKEQFAQFKQELAAMTAAIQVDGKPITAAAKMIGTSVNFYSGNPKKPLGHHFDKKGPKTGDVDIELTSPELVSELMKDPTSEGNDKVIIGGQKQIFKNEVRKGREVVGGFHAKFPQFKEFCAKWSKILGRGSDEEPAVDIKLKMDLTPISQVPKPSAGPIEVLRKE